MHDAFPDPAAGSSPPASSLSEAWKQSVAYSISAAALVCIKAGLDDEMAVAMLNRQLRRLREENTGQGMN
jgi:hypothetical protein